MTTIKPLSEDEAEVIAELTGIIDELHEAMVTVGNHRPGDDDHPLRAWLEEYGSVIAATAIYSYWMNICADNWPSGSTRWRRESIEAAREAVLGGMADVGWHS